MAEKALQKICFRKDVPAKARQKECIKAGPFFVHSSESGLLPRGLRAGPGGLRALIFVCLSVCMGARLASGKALSRLGACITSYWCRQVLSGSCVRPVLLPRLLLCRGCCEMTGRAQAALPGKQGARHKCG